MKKIVCCVLAALMLLALCACGAEKAPVTYGFIDETLGVESYAIGFRKDDTELCDLINAALDALAEDGTYDQIGQKYPEIYDFLCLNK